MAHVIMCNKSQRGLRPWNKSHPCSTVSTILPNPSRTFRETSHNWRQAGVAYFVTFRLADSIPQVRLRQWRQERALWLRTHPEPHSPEQVAEFWKRFPERFHRWLDANYGDCILDDGAAKGCMECVLRHFGR